ncbi:DUF2637 domain-containing protein [Streptomyces sp. Ac-502]|uniref:DUF2637 domain-containing protein n=1 Tax=Streptomyces sp. Ac-502 TaxID=3342801 RepID=UPI0038625102
MISGPLFRDQTAQEPLSDLCAAARRRVAVDGLDAELAELLRAAEPAVVPAGTGAGPARHRKHAPAPPSRERPRPWRQLVARLAVLLTAAVVAVVSVLGAAACYPPLHHVAAGAAPPGIAALWPLLIFAPWIAATLSILRGRVHRRRTAHAWCVVVFCAATATTLCVLSAPTTPCGITVAVLPPVTVVLCFHQLVRQLDQAGAPVAPGPARHAAGVRGYHRLAPR